MSSAPAPEDRIPHDSAVWRPYEPGRLINGGAPAPGTSGRQVSIDYGAGQITLSWGHEARWIGAKRWRFGWPPA